MTSVPPPVQAPQVPVGVAPHRGTLILILGIAGPGCCGICGIIAWVMGNRDLKLMAAGQMDPAGRGLTNAGRILGIIGVLWMVVSIIIVIAAWASIMAMFMAMFMGHASRMPG